MSVDLVERYLRGEPLRKPTEAALRAYIRGWLKDNRPPRGNLLLNAVALLVGFELRPPAPCTCDCGPRWHGEDGCCYKNGHDVYCSCGSTDGKKG